ncbi:hypothetical protein J6590_020798 [Homalodisca vitripennis]|nr:hypothetical protein J6590_020798 [Homalodisca vitripennis]
MKEGLRNQHLSTEAKSCLCRSKRGRPAHARGSGKEGKGHVVLRRPPLWLSDTTQVIKYGRVLNRGGMMRGGGGEPQQGMCWEASLKG